ncbi:probable methyltransferase At1g29790 [Magnolia sinica]|uniref:probable methyltransferase At1g29790 n=1 Tax=Magnolia sinica TaxID=86752 RepID=UPI002658C1E9|nr:probable methyltransferase At1g29790 [Magnolia sinica]
MGSSEDHLRKPQKDSNIKSKLKILLLVITTNILIIYLFASPSFKFNLSDYTPNIPLPLWDFHALHDELNTTQSQLTISNARITELHRLLDTLLYELAHIRESDSDHADQSTSSNDWSGHLTSELKLAVNAHKFPLGRSPNTGTDELYPPLGAACRQYQDELNQYMTYKVGGECPVDDVFAQRLMLKGCEPLPRRRCHPKSPIGYVEPRPYPASLWATPPDTSIIWDPYTCKNYQCLIDRKNTKGFQDCKDCFDLHSREIHRWLFDKGLDYGMDEVLHVKPPGTIRIGLDIGGGTGSFAVRMRERNVTIITSTMNFDGPFNSFIASRGFIPMHISIFHRLPFFENTLDIVHSMHVLNNWIPDTMLEFTLYDIYRVLRPGGLFWLDRFFCAGSQLNTTYIPMFNRVGFNKLRWNTGRKLDRGIELNEWYLSALLEKPMT